MIREEGGEELHLRKLKTGIYQVLYILYYS